MHSPFAHSTNPYDLGWSGMADVGLRPNLLVARDGSGYRVVDILDLGAIVSVSGVNITGIVNNEQVTRIATSGSGDPFLANMMIIDGLGRVTALSQQSGPWSFALTGGNGGKSVDVDLVSGHNAIPVYLASGSMGGGGSSGPAIPTRYFTYAINLTGNGVFSNYASAIPNVVGAPVILSVEPDSDNSDKVWYAFSGSASTGQAFELRGDKSFSISGTTDIFFAQATGSNRVMIHVEVY